MAIVYKDIAVQGTASVGTYATLYSASATSIIGTLGICNTASTDATYRVGVMGSAGTPSGAEWRLYDAAAPANDTVALTIGMVVESGDFVRVSSSASTVVFFGSVSEIS
jgi:hypothetical protein